MDDRSINNIQLIVRYHFPQIIDQPDNFGLICKIFDETFYESHI